MPDATVAPLFSSLTTNVRQNDVSTGSGQQIDANAAEKVETWVEPVNQSGWMERFSERHQMTLVCGV